MKRILVALDASPRAPLVLAQAIALAESTDAKLRLFRAVPIQPEIPWDMIREFPPGGLEELLRRHAEADLRARARAVAPNRLDGIEAAIGTPWSAICEAARAWQADLVVMGSHGYGGADRLLGTTAGKVVNHAPCSVLIAR